MSYFMGLNGVGFGGADNFMQQVGSLGPAWRNSLMDGMNMMNNIYAYQNQRMVEPYQVQAVASQYGNAALQNQLNTQMTENQLAGLLYRMQYGDLEKARQAAMNEGMNLGEYIAPKQEATYSMQPLPNAAQPSEPAMTGGYAATAPNAFPFYPTVNG